MLCSRCKKRVAVVFMTRMENGKTINEGLCLQCAKELGIGPVNELMEKMGITDDEIENMNDQLMGMIDENGEEIDPDLDPDDPDFVPGGAQTFPFFQNMFGKMNGASGQNPQDPAEKRTRRPDSRRILFVGPHQRGKTICHRFYRSFLRDFFDKKQRLSLTAKNFLLYYHFVK